MDSVFQQEQKRLEMVKETIAQELGKLEELTSKSKNEIVHIRKHFWDEVKVNVESFDDYLETIISLRQEAQALSVNQSTHKHASKRVATLRKMKEIPYFGRIDLTEEGFSNQEQIYIGISSLSDESGEDFLIYDWRAPISSVYYDYQPGPVKYKTPSGPVHGTLERKWQYVIRRGVLESMFDTSITIGDEILQQVLGKGTDKQMHSIVATIQQEQNRIIRHDAGKLLIVHGTAGSGKTSAALQRIAYLLYKYRDQIKADQIILFSPNNMFSSYVSSVLPELGEENMQQVTFQEYLNHRLSKEFQVETPYEQLEYVLTAEKTPSYNARISSIEFKASIQFFEAIQAYRHSLATEGMQFKDVRFRGKPIVTAQQIAKRFYGHDKSLQFSNRIAKLQEWLLNRLNEVQGIERKQAWVQEAMELISDEQYNKAHRHLAKRKGLRGEEIDNYEVEPEALARLIVEQKLKPVRNKIRNFDFIDFKGIYKRLFVDPSEIRHWMEGELPIEWPEICRTTMEMLDEEKLYYEDAIPFLHLKEQITGFEKHSSIKHIVIDEAQDYSSFQFEFLKRLFPAAKMTVLGDFNQAIFAHASGKGDFNTLASLYGPDETEVINLTRSYRSTKPIIEFTRQLVANGDKIIPFERAGEKPQLTVVADDEDLHSQIASKITEWQSLGLNSMAIICKSAEESLRAYEALSGIENIKLLKSSSTEYEQGVVVVPSYLAKGIEFDAVIIYDASERVYGEDSLRNLFYTACTRAMHHLQLYSIGEPSPFIKDSMSDGLLED